MLTSKKNFEDFPSHSPLIPHIESATNPDSPSWYERNRDKSRQTSQAWREANPERYRQLQRDWARKHRVTRRRAGRKSPPQPFDYKELLADQLGGCAICERKPTPKKALLPDFDHSGKARGLLCSKCIIVLEYFNTIKRFEQAIRYLKGTNGGFKVVLPPELDDYQKKSKSKCECFGHRDCPH